MSSTPIGACPACGAEGQAGQPCGSAACLRRRCHFIPQQYLKPGEPRDAQLGQLIGDHLLVAVLGRGGYGKVYLALKLPLLMKVALKRLLIRSSDAALKQGLLSKFEGEAKSLSQLDHPNIVRLLHYGATVDVPYLVMEFVAGGRTLKQELMQHISEERGFGFSRILHIVEQILNGLECAHAQHIVHRDIKPDNVMLQKVAGDDDFVRIVDFGLAKFVEKRRITDALVGTPAYIAPEQIHKQNIGPWSDLYALATMMVEMVLGMRVLVADTPQELLRRKAEPDFDPLAGLVERILPQSTLGFFRRALAVDPGHRIRNVVLFRHEMQRAFAELVKLPQQQITTTDLQRVLRDREFLHMMSERARLEEAWAKIEQAQRELASKQEQLQEREEQLAGQTESVEETQPPTLATKKTVVLSDETRPPSLDVTLGAEQQSPRSTERTVQPERQVISDPAAARRTEEAARRSAERALRSTAATRLSPTSWVLVGVAGAALLLGLAFVVLRLLFS